MKAIKGLLIYIGIVLAIILGICILLFSLMYFIPSFRIFGVGVVHSNETKNQETIVMTDYTGYSDIELNLSSKKVNINVVPNAEAKDVSYSLKLGTFGIAFDITEYRIVRTIKIENNTLKINLNVSEPDGWISNNSSYMNIVVPADLVYNILARSNSGNVLLGGNNAVLNMEKLTVNTGTGDLRLTNVAKDGSLTLKALNLTTNLGVMNFSAIDTLNVESKVMINSKNGEFSFNKLNADLDVRGTGIKLAAHTINCESSGLMFMSENGKFDVINLNSVGGAENTIVTENCNVKIENVSGDTGVITTYGNIYIAKAMNDLILESTHGAIVVNEALGDIRASSEYGNIKCLSYMQSGTFINKSGEIRILNKSEFNENIETVVKTEDGNVKVENLVNKLILNITGDAAAEVIFYRVATGLSEPFANIINTGSNGRCEVFLPGNPGNVAFKFTAKGNISGEISGLDSDYGGEAVHSDNNPQFYPNMAEADKDLWHTCCSYIFTGTIVFNSHLKTAPNA